MTIIITLTQCRGQEKVSMYILHKLINYNTNLNFLQKTKKKC